MRRTALFACMLMFIIDACTLYQPPILASPANTKSQPSKTHPAALTPVFFVPPTTIQPTQEVLPTSLLLPTALLTDTLTPTETTAAKPQPSETQLPTLTPTLPCEVDTATLKLSASVEDLRVGDVVIVKVKVTNDGCVALGLPQYRLYIQSDNPESIFTPDNPEPIVHYLAVGPGQSDFVEFTLTAVIYGQASLTASVSYEVHLGYPGPAYRGSAGTREPLLITIAPR